MNHKYRLSLKPAAPLTNLTPLSIAVANDYLEQVDFVGFINRSVIWDQQRTKVSPGELAKSIVLSTFHGGRAPLLGISRQLAALDVEYLFDAKYQASDFTDDALARMLDKLSDAGPETLFSSFSLSCLSQFAIPTRRLHADTTSISLQGNYSESEEENYEGLIPSRGYSKDNRPDLKQVIVGKVVNEHGLSVSSMTLDGNTSDVEYNRLAMKTLAQTFGQQMNQMIYIADSKLVNMPNLKFLQEQKDSEGKAVPIRFISRVPDSFSGKLVVSLKREAYNQNNWQEQGTFGKGKQCARYETCGIEQEVGGLPLRFLVVKTSAGEERAERILTTEKTALCEELSKLEATAFACQPDAEHALLRFQKDHRRCRHQIEWSIESEQTEKRLPGNPGKNPKPPTVIVTWKVCGRIVGPIEEKVSELRQKEESFVLITNVPESELADRDVLREYKEQHVVETQFRLLKQPAVVNAIFLKTPSRIDSLVMLLSVALLVRGLIQYNVRQRLSTRTTPPKIGVNRTALKSPTAEFVIQELRYTILERQQDMLRCKYGNDQDMYRIKEWLDLLGLDWL